MILGIDASNIRAGGGVTHLVELLRAAVPQKHGFEKVTVWGSRPTLDGLEDRPWLKKIYVDLLNRSLPCRLYWQRFMLEQAIHCEVCDIIFSPGGAYSGTLVPFVSMSQNLLPFEWSEAKRYGFSWQLFRNILLRFSQSKSFRAANGVIFLTEYARTVVMKVMKAVLGKTTIISHGISKSFIMSPRPQKDLSGVSNENPFRVLYVSIIDVYKHQWNVAEAVAQLKKEGFPVELNLVGPAYGPALRYLNKKLRKLDAEGSYIHYHGSVPYEEIFYFYHQADLFVFASSCETFGLILAEAMAAGLPIACTNRGPMPEVLGNAGLYFDPEDPVEIANVIRMMLDSPNLRAEKADAAYRRAMEFTWARCAEKTFQFLSQTVRNSS